jgi:hypothetical protein
MTTFHNVGGINERNNISSIEDNMKSFLDWSFLNIGGFINVKIPNSGITTTGNLYTLKPVIENSTTAIKTWEGLRKDWVYESGINYNNFSPTAISGIFLNGNYLPGPTGSGNYGYNINYPLGRVVFNNSVSSTSNVRLDYSYRYVQTYKANEAIWWKEVQAETYNPANYKPSGDYSITANNRAQLPAIVIETIPRTVLLPHQLGTAENIVIQDIFLHVFTENPTHRNNLLDILVAQKDKAFNLYDIDMVNKLKIYPLNIYGNINPTGLNFPALSNNYKKYWCTIKDSTIGEINNISSKLFNGIVRWSVEIFP